MPDVGRLRNRKRKDHEGIIATHSPIVMAYPKAEILQFSDTGIQQVLYKETEHYQITKQFIDRPEQMMKYLLNE